MSNRKPPNLTEKLAAALILLMEKQGDLGAWRRLKETSAERICEDVEWDHYPVRVETARALGWSWAMTNHPTNLRPMLKADHLFKTAKKDAPEIAKGRRIIKANEEHHAKMRAKMLPPYRVASDAKERTSRWPKRKMAGRRSR